MSHKKISLGSLFYNNKFVMIFSVFCALVIWVVFATRNTEEIPRTVTDVPIVVNLSDSAQQSGLKVFSPVNAKAKVAIKGNSLTVNQVKNTDLQIEAKQAASLTGPVSNYKLELSATKLGNLSNYEVVSIEPSSILVTVDYYSEKVFNIDTSQITPPVDPQYYLNAPTLSSDSVTVSGPKQEVDQVAKVIIPYEQDKTPLTETKHFTGKLVMLDADGNEIKSDSLTLSMDAVDVTCNVLYRKVLPLQVEFTGKPSGLDDFESRVTVEPKEIEVAGPEDAFANISELALPAIDFTTISPSSDEFDVDVSLPTGFKNVSNIYTAKVKLDLDTFTTRTMALNPDTITFKNLPAGYQAEVYTQSLSVTIVGPPSEIEAFTENNLVAQIDMTGKENFTGQTEVPVTISVTGAPNSWVYGSYMVNIGVSAKME